MTKREKEAVVLGLLLIVLGLLIGRKTVKGSSGLREDVQAKMIGWSF